MQAHRQLHDRPQRPERAGEQLGDVVAGHVLDHLAAALRERAVGERHAHTDHEVARAAVAGAQGAGVGRGHDPSDGGAAVRRVEREHLARLGERGLGVGEQHARLKHRGQVARVVLDDGVQSRGGELDRPGGAGRAQPILVAPPRKRTGVPASQRH